MKIFKCEHCLKELSSKSSLNNHIRNAKYCIEKRTGEIFEIIIFKCDHCSKEFSSKQILLSHIPKCLCKIKNEYEEKLKQKTVECEEKLKQKTVEYEEKLKQKTVEYEEKLSFFKKELKDSQKHIQEILLKAVSRPTTVSNVSNKTNINYIQNMQSLTDEHFTDNVQHLTLEHIKKGAEGYAEYALDYPLKDRMMCSDYSRRKVKFKDDDGNIVVDPEMTVLTKKFFNSIKDKNKEIIFKCTDELKED